MTRDRVVIDLPELREAAAVLRGQADGVADMVARLPSELPEAPAATAPWICDALCHLQAELATVVDELAMEASALEARATEVETADARWWTVGAEGVTSGCCLPSGEVVIHSGSSTATSSASGPGMAEPVLVRAASATSSASGPGVAPPPGANALTASSWVAPPGHTTVVGTDPLTGQQMPIYQPAPPPVIYVANDPGPPGQGRLTLQQMQNFGLINNAEQTRTFVQNISNNSMAGFWGAGGMSSGTSLANSGGFLEPVRTRPGGTDQIY